MYIALLQSLKHCLKCGSISLFYTSVVTIVVWGDCMSLDNPGDDDVAELRLVCCKQQCKENHPFLKCAFYLTQQT